MSNSTAEKEGLAVYEIGYLVLPSIPEADLDGVVSAIRKIISKEGGAEIDAEAPFKHPLAYPMTKTLGASRYVVNDAYIGWIKFEVEPANVLAVKAGVEKLDEVLRFLLVKVPRETTFTFAKAKALAAEKERKAREAEEARDRGEESKPAEPGVEEEVAVA